MAQADQVGVIGKGIVIRGNLTGGGNLVIEGRVEGQIALKNHLTIENTGRVTGNIQASDKVELKADCRVVGDVKAPRILIADGASFKGNVDMDVKER